MAERYNHKPVTPRPDYPVAGRAPRRTAPQPARPSRTAEQNNNNAGNYQIPAQQPARPQRTAPQKTKKLTKKGKQKRAFFAGAAILVLIIIIAIAKGGSGKTKVTTKNAKLMDMETCISVDAILTSVDDQIYCDFIDNDYIEHGIAEGEKGTVENPDDPDNPYEVVVDGIEAFDADDETVKYLSDVLATEASVPDTTEEETTEDTDAEEETTDVSGDETEEETTETASDKVYVIKCTLSKAKDETISISPDTKVTINLTTATTKGAVAVPDEAIITNDDMTKSVLTIESKKIKVVKVLTGIQSNGYTEITSGITLNAESKPTQAVVVAAADKEINQLTDGEKVKATAEKE